MTGGRSLSIAGTVEGADVCGSSQTILTEHHADADAGARQRAAALVEAARPVPPLLSPEALARVRRRVDRRLSGRGTAVGGFASVMFPGRRSLSAAGTVAALLLLSAMGAGAALWRYRRVEPPVTEAAPRAAAPARPHQSKARRRAVAQVAVGAEAPGEPELPVAPAATIESPPAAPVAAAHEVDRRPARRLVAPAPPPAETEARLLAQALGQLRQQNDPGAALATLDRLERRFPGGVLADEARATRIEAAVASHDLGTATRLVEGATIPAGRSGVAILVTRGELRAQAGRCGDAVADFSQVLAQGSLAAGELAARALYGRAVCLQRTGQAARARGDLEALRREHPRSRLGREAERLLADAPGAD